MHWVIQLHLPGVQTLIIIIKSAEEDAEQLLPLQHIQHQLAGVQAPLHILKHVQLVVIQCHLVLMLPHLLGVLTHLIITRTVQPVVIDFRQ